MKLKYIILNVIGVIVFVVIILLYNFFESQPEFEYGYVDENGKETSLGEASILVAEEKNASRCYITDTTSHILAKNLEGLIIFFPFIFFGIVATLTTIRAKGKCEYGKTTKNIVLIISGIFLIYMIIKSVIWKINDITEVHEATSWGITIFRSTSNYKSVFTDGIFGAILIIICAYLTRLYIYIISWLTSKITLKERNK